VTGAFERPPGIVERRFLLVGLTGGIATGKSTVSAMFGALGAEIVDADLLAREVVEPGEPAYHDVVAEFGGDVVQADGALDRKKLGAIVFADPARRKRLEQITHPAIRARFLQRLATLAASGFAGIVFFDAPVMIESGNYKNMERMVVVVTDEPTQVSRQMARDGVDRDEAERKIRSQMPLGEKAKLADYVIDNGADRAATEAQVERVGRALMADLRARDAGGQPPSG
jgi:dephospho-CoA kinase